MLNIARLNLATSVKSSLLLHFDKTANNMVCIITKMFKHEQNKMVIKKCAQCGTFFVLIFSFFNGRIPLFFKSTKLFAAAFSAAARCSADSTSVYGIKIALIVNEYKED